jgi:hypothetical protein
MGAEQEVRQQPRQPGPLPFAAVCDLFDSLAGQKTAVIRQLVRRFVQAALPDGCAGAYQLIRLVKAFLLMLNNNWLVIHVCILHPQVMHRCM